MGKTPENDDVYAIAYPFGTTEENVSDINIKMFDNSEQKLYLCKNIWILCLEEKMMITM